MTKVDTHDEVMRFCEQRRAEMDQCFERLGRFEEGGFSFMAYVFATRTFVNEDFDTAPLEHVEAFPVRAPSFVHALPASRHTAIFSYVVGEYVKKVAAVGTLMMGESWMVTTPKEAGTVEEARAWRRDQPESLEHVEGRREAMFMSLEHQTVGKRFWTNDILREPTRLGGWVLRSFVAEEGRMVGLGVGVSS